MRIEEFNYCLPRNLIAQKPARPRDYSRLMVVETKKRKIFHHKFFEIEKFLKRGDILVINNSKVIPARLLAKKESGGKVEILLLEKIGCRRWKALLKNYKLEGGAKRIFIEKKLEALVEKNIKGNIWQIKFNLADKKFKKLLNQLGKAPTPPYIKSKPNLSDYQTVYAKTEGSVAAPTAGFHFTNDLIKKLKNQGIKFETITLHVGLGTFEPIRGKVIENHKMRPEIAIISSKTAERLNQAKKEGRRIIAVGTTTTRTLENFSTNNGMLRPGKKKVDLFIFPGYKFKIINGLITNFHLPKSTNLTLVGAFLQFKGMKNGIRNLLQLYQKAIKKYYRFYSFGDAMLII